jgi:uncharacterized protein DUF397
MTSSLATKDVPSPQEKEHGMVEVPPPPATASWQMSSVSGVNACVQVAHTQEYFWVRDSKNLLGPALGFTCEGWAVFIAGVQCDEITRSGAPA